MREDGVHRIGGRDWWVTRDEPDGHYYVRPSDDRWLPPLVFAVGGPNDWLGFPGELPEWATAMGDAARKELLDELSRRLDP